MNILPQDMVPVRRPSTGYSISFAIACTAIAFIGVALEEGPGVSHTGLGSLCSQAGTVGLVLAFAIGFLVRLVFWPRISREAQALVRTAITTVFMASILVTAVLVVACLHGLSARPAPIEMTAFTIMSVLCQIATVVWLARYRSA